MKKILLLLLLATFSIQAQTLQTPTYGNVKLKNNTTDNSATKVNVQSTDGTINTISKSDLVNVVEVNGVPTLPLVGEVGKIYVVKNVNKIYRWNGTFYQELAGSDISGLQAQIDLKANDSDVLHKTGNETKTGNLSIIGTTSVKSANPKGSFHVFTGTSGSDIDLADQENGSISFSNSGGSTASPAITSKSNDANGLTILTGTNNTNPLYDMGFQVSENDNTDFSTLTTKAYSFKRHNIDLLTMLRNGNSTFLGNVKSSGFNTDTGTYLNGTKIPFAGGSASFYNSRTITTHAHYGFLENSDLDYAGVGVQGNASFNDNINIIGIQNADHHYSYQSYPHYNNTGTTTKLGGFFMQPDVNSGIITNLFEFEANNPTGSGGVITNLHGLHIRELTRGTNNYAIFTEGATPSFIGGAYLGNNKIGIGGTITPTANLEVIDSNQTTSGDGNVTIRTTDSQAADKGGLLTFGGSYSGTSRTIFGGISGRKENSTNGNIAGYLSLYSSSPTIGLVEAARINSNGTTNFNYSVTAPTATAGTNTTQIATTAFVQANSLALTGGTLSGAISGTSATFSSSVQTTQYKISALNTAPASATATGTTGEIRITSGFIYICIATNTWVRAALTTWI